MKLGWKAGTTSDEPVKGMVVVHHEAAMRWSMKRAISASTIANKKSGL